MHCLLVRRKILRLYFGYTAIKYTKFEIGRRKMLRLYFGYTAI